MTLTTEPEIGAQVLLDGVALGTTPLVDAEITPGVHQLEFTAERYLAAARELDVAGASERQALAVTLTPDWGVVSLNTSPPGATVLVDGAEAGITPAAIEIMSGEHDVEVRLAGHNAWRTKVLVESNQPQQLPDVTLAQADGRVEVASNPSEASVSVDGEFRGRTPLSLRLSPGRTHRLALTKPGYETATSELSVGADSGRRLQIDLTPQYGDIEVASTPPADVWVDGQRRGSTPVTLQLTAVSHAIEVRRDGFAVERAALTPRPGFPQKLAVTLTQLDESSGGGFASFLRTSAGQELKLVPAGQFTMGSSRREVGRRSNEPLRPVRVTRAFYLGAREVTNAEFRAFKPDHDSGDFEGESLNGDDQPVVNVSWEDVVQYLNDLSIKDGLQPVYEEGPGGWAAVQPLRNGYRLPTDAEWEWAARFAGQTQGLLYPWGDGSAAARSLGQLRGRLGRADAADGAGHLRRRLRRQRAGRHLCGQRLRHLRSRRQRRRVDPRLLHARRDGVDAARRRSAGARERRVARRARRQLAQRDGGGLALGRARLRLRRARRFGVSDRAQSAMRAISCATLWFDSDMRWLRLAVPAVVLAAWLAASFAQQAPPAAGTPPASTPPASTPPASTPPPAAPPAAEEEEAAAAPSDEAAEEVFIPTEELQPDAAITFPVDI